MRRLAIAVFVFALCLGVRQAAAQTPAPVVRQLSMSRLNGSLKIEHEWQQTEVAFGFADSKQNLAGLGLSYSLGTSLYLTGGARLPFDNGLKFGPARWDVGFSYNVIRDGKFHL